MLELTGYHCWLPGGAHAVDDLSLTATPGTITALVGRSGCGAASLVTSLSGHLPPGSRVTGSAMLTGRRIDGATPDELAGRVMWISDTALPGSTVADCLRILTGDLSALDDLGIADAAERRLSSLPVDLRLRLHCASLAATTAAPDLILVDRVLGAADAPTRSRFCALLRQRAAAGATVVWAEHDLDAVWEHADTLVELDGGRFAWSGRPDRWRPCTLPEPTLLTLARALGVPPAHCRTPLDTRAALEHAGLQLPPFPLRLADRVAPRGAGSVIEAESVGMTGPAIEIRPGECLGIIDVEARPEPLARQLIAELPAGDVVPSQPPPTLRLGPATRAWERRHHLGVGSVMSQLPSLQPRDLLIDLSPGDLARLRQALAADPATPLWVPHPQAGLDPRERHALAENLRRHPAGTRLITSRDIEFLVRACHRLIVVSGNSVIGDGSPSAIVHLLPTRPLISRAVDSTRYLRLTDVLATTDELSVPDVLTVDEQAFA